MDADKPSTFSLAMTYVHLTGVGAAQLADGGEAFWRRSRLRRPMRVLRRGMMEPVWDDQSAG